MGYRLGAEENPVFLYRISGLTVTDAIRALANGEGVSRDVSITGPLQNIYFRLAEGQDIVELKEGLYAIDHNTYYLRLESPGGEKPFVRNSNGKKELLIPVSGQLKYSILF